MTPTHRLALRNSAATVLAKGIPAGVRIGFLLWYAKQNGPQAFGRIALCLAIVEVLRVLTDFGTENLFIRSLARAESPHTRTDLLARFGTFRLVAIVLGLLCYFIAAVAFLPSPLAAPDLLASLLLVTSTGMGYAFTFYQAQLNMERAAQIVLSTAVVGVSILIFAAPGNETAQLSFLIAVEATTAAWLVHDVTRRTGIRWRDAWRFTSSLDMRAVAQESAPLAGVTLLVAAYTRLDVLMIGPLAGSLALGLYSFAYRVSEPFRFLASGVEATLYSYLSVRTDISGSITRMQRLLLLVGSYAFALGTLAGLTGWLFVHFGYIEYRDVLPTLAILSAALMFRCVNGFLVALLYARAQYTSVLRIAMCNAALMAVLIYPCISLLGIAGAALALLAVEILNCLLQTRLAFARAADSCLSRITTTT